MRWPDSSFNIKRFVTTTVLVISNASVIAHENGSSILTRLIVKMRFRFPADDFKREIEQAFILHRHSFWVRIIHQMANHGYMECFAHYLAIACPKWVSQDGWWWPEGGWVGVVLKY